MPKPDLLAGTWMRNALDHIQTRRRYRFYSLYGLLIVMTVITMWCWPATGAYWTTLRDAAWVRPLTQALEMAALSLAVVLAFIGFLRKGWLPKVISIFAIYQVIELKSSWLLQAREGAWEWFAWHILERPLAWLGGLAQGDPGAETGFYAIYLFVLWLILRPFAKVGYRRIQWLESRIIRSFPSTRQWAKPLF